MEPFIGQIMQVGFNFAPVQWAVCGGQLLPISQNSALFSLLGTNFGGDGRVTFGLPNLQGRVIIGSGRSTGSTFEIGEAGGQESVTLTVNEMPSHTHAATFTPTGGGGAVTVKVASTIGSASLSTPVDGSSLGAGAGNTAAKIYTPAGYSGATVSIAGISGGGGGGTVAVGNTGGNRPTSILPPFQSVLQIIALSGVFPSRS